MTPIRPWALTLGLIVFSTTACYEHTFTVGQGARIAAPVVYQEWHSHWLGGLIGERTMLRILDAVEGVDIGTHPEIVPHSLVVRESTAPPA